MRWSALVLAVAASLYALPAFADPSACTSSAEQGQKARAQGKLLDAHRSFLACSASECPAVVAKDCTTWAAEVLAATPTIVIDAKDEAGHDVGDATLTIDGKVIANQLDGKAVPVDIGSHSIDISRGSKHVTQTLIAKEGEKARRLAFVVSAPSSAPPPTSSPAPAETSSPPTASTVGPWIVTGLGAVLIISGIVLHLTAGDYPPGCDADTAKCQRLAGDPPVPNNGSPDTLLDARRADAGNVDGKHLAGTIGIIAGSPLVVAGLIWYFVAKKPSPRTAIAPWYEVSSGGFMMQTKF